MNGRRRNLLWVIPARFFDKQYLSYRLAERPMLRVILYSPWFRIALAAAILITLFAVASLIPAWRTSPEGVNPVIRVSALGWVQARRLRAAGEAAFKSGKYAVADLALRAAFDRNPAEAETARALLRNMAAARQANVALRLNPAIPPWLLQLSQTNLADLELAAGMMAAYDDWGEARRLLAPFAEGLSRSGAETYLKSMFYAAPAADFREDWDRLRAGEWAGAGLRLYRLADIQGAEDLARWDRAFAEASREPGLAQAAWRLQLAVGERLGDPDRYRPALVELQRTGRDPIEAHARYWRLLAGHGRAAEARALAMRHNVATSDAKQLMRLAEAYVELRLFESALELLREARMDTRVPERGVVLYADILRNAREWERLRAAALHIRELFPRLQGYSVYLEALAEERLGHAIRADIVLQKLPEASFDSFPLAVATIDSLLGIGRIAAARGLLARFAEKRAQDPLYWRAACRLAAGARDSGELLRSARALRDLLPNDPETLRWRIAALLAARAEPADALALTARGIGPRTRNGVRLVNYAAALNLNGEFKQAQLVLRRVQPGRLPPPLRARCHLARFEAELGLGRAAEAREIYGEIDRSWLFSGENAALNRLYDERLASVLNDD